MPLALSGCQASWLSLGRSASIKRGFHQVSSGRQATLVTSRSFQHICASRHGRPNWPSAGHTLNGLVRRLSIKSTGSNSIILGTHVREALANGQPVVALESTVITHGLPEPRNLELALELEHEISSGRWWSEHEDSVSSRGERTPMMSGQVVPATVGIIEGRLIVGLDRAQIEFLANEAASRPIKASRRDLAIAQAGRLSAGTTVSATMAIASSVRLAAGSTSSSSLAGRISVFATGGLGGVHLGGEHSMDISADLYEMARSPIGLVSSGFKSFLDARRSLEFLETMGCTVVSLGQTLRAHQAGPGSGEQVEWRPAAAGQVHGEVGARKGHLFPGFFSAANRQGAKSPWQCATIQEAAQILFHCLGPVDAKQAFSGAGTSENGLLNARAMLLACPIPSEFALNQEAQQDDKLIEQLVQRVDSRTDLSGAEKTPLILAELARLTAGRTLEANLALLRNNARIGAHLAYEYARLREKVGANEPAATPTASRQPPPPTGPIVIGCTMIDMHVSTKIDDQFKSNAHRSGVTFHGEPHLTLGGVGRNLAAALELLAARPLFITSLAGDNLGEFARNEMAKLNFQVNGCGGGGGGQQRARMVVLGERGAASCSCFALVLMDSLSGECEYVIANLEAASAISRPNLETLRVGERASGTLEMELERAPLLVLDANLSTQTLRYLMELSARKRVPIFMEPTDVVCLPQLVASLKSGSPGAQVNEATRSLAFMSPNVVELAELLRLLDARHNGTGEPSASADWLAARQTGSLEDIKSMATRLMDVHLPHLKCLLVTLDKRGVLVAARVASEHFDDCTLMTFNEQTSAKLAQAQPLASQPVNFKLYTPERVREKPISASGAGDCFAAGFISALLQELPLRASIELAFRAAACALDSKSTVPHTLSQLVAQTNERPTHLEDRPN